MTETGRMSATEPNRSNVPKSCIAFAAYSIYALDVPVSPPATEGGEARYACCHLTEAQGHAQDCAMETRVRVIEAALQRTGIGFVRVTEESRHVIEIQPAPGSEPELGETSPFLDFPWNPALLEPPPQVGVHPDAHPLLVERMLRVTRHDGHKEHSWLKFQDERQVAAAVAQLTDALNVVKKTAERQFGLTVVMHASPEGPDDKLVTTTLREVRPDSVRGVSQ